MKYRAIAVVLLLALAGLRAVASPIYAIGASNEGHGSSLETLYVVDPITGVLTRVGPVDAGTHPIGLESLAFSPGLGLFGVGQGALYQINTGTGQATKVGLTSANLKALVNGPNGVTYGIQGNSLYSLDLSTGKTSLIGSGKYAPAEALEFDALGVLYATVGGEGGSSLYRIDPTTGAGTRVGAIGFGGVEGLAFIDGTMYGFTDNGLEITINLTTGAGAFVRALGMGLDALASDPPADTPEPATVWLTGAALSACYGWRRFRRKPP